MTPIERINSIVTSLDSIRYHLIEGNEVPGSLDGILHSIDEELQFIDIGIVDQMMKTKGRGK